MKLRMNKRVSLPVGRELITCQSYLSFFPCVGFQEQKLYSFRKDSVKQFKRRSINNNIFQVGNNYDKSRIE